MILPSFSNEDQGQAPWTEPRTEYLPPDVLAKQNQAALNNIAAAKREAQTPPWLGAMAGPAGWAVSGFPTVRQQLSKGQSAQDIVNYSQDMVSSFRNYSKSNGLDLKDYSDEQIFKTFKSNPKTSQVLGETFLKMGALDTVDTTIQSLTKGYFSYLASESPKNLATTVKAAGNYLQRRPDINPTTTAIDAIDTLSSSLKDVKPIGLDRSVLTALSSPSGLAQSVISSQPELISSALDFASDNLKKSYVPPPTIPKVFEAQAFIGKQIADAAELGEDTAARFAERFRGFQVRTEDPLQQTAFQVGKATGQISEALLTYRGALTRATGVSDITDSSAKLITSLGFIKGDFANTYNQALDKGLDEKDALNFALTAAAGSYVLEKLPLDYILENKSLIKSVATKVLGEEGYKNLAKNKFLKSRFVDSLARAFEYPATGAFEGTTEVIQDAFLSGLSELGGYGSWKEFENTYKDTFTVSLFAGMLGKGLGQMPMTFKQQAYFLKKKYEEEYADLTTPKWDPKAGKMVAVDKSKIDKAMLDRKNQTIQQIADGLMKNYELLNKAKAISSVRKDLKSSKITPDEAVKKLSEAGVENAELLKEVLIKQQVYASQQQEDRIDKILVSAGDGGEKQEKPYTILRSEAETGLINQAIKIYNDEIPKAEEGKTNFLEIAFEGKGAEMIPILSNTQMDLIHSFIQTHELVNLNDIRPLVEFIKKLNNKYNVFIDVTSTKFTDEDSKVNYMGRTMSVAEFTQSLMDNLIHPKNIKPYASQESNNAKEFNFDPKLFTDVIYGRRSVDFDKNANPITPEDKTDLISLAGILSREQMVQQFGEVAVSGYESAQVIKEIIDKLENKKQEVEKILFDAGFVSPDPNMPNWVYNEILSLAMKKGKYSKITDSEAVIAIKHLASDWRVPLVQAKVTKDSVGWMNELESYRKSQAKKEGEEKAVFFYRFLNPVLDEITNTFIGMGEYYSDPTQLQKDLYRVQRWPSKLIKKVRLKLSNVLNLNDLPSDFRAKHGAKADSIIDLYNSMWSNSIIVRNELYVEASSIDLQKGDYRYVRWVESPKYRGMRIHPDYVNGLREVEANIEGPTRRAYSNLLDAIYNNNNEINEDILLALKELSDSSLISGTVPLIRPSKVYDRPDLLSAIKELGYDGISFNGKITPLTPNKIYPVTDFYIDENRDYQESLDRNSFQTRLFSSEILNAVRRRMDAVGNGIIKVFSARESVKNFQSFYEGDSLDRNNVSQELLDSAREGQLPVILVSQEESKYFPRTKHGIAYQTQFLRNNRGKVIFYNTSEVEAEYHEWVSGKFEVGYSVFGESLPSLEYGFLTMDEWKLLVLEHEKVHAYGNLDSTDFDEPMVTIIALERIGRFDIAKKMENDLRRRAREIKKLDPKDSAEASIPAMKTVPFPGAFEPSVNPVKVMDLTVTSYEVVDGTVDVNSDGLIVSAEGEAKSNIGESISVYDIPEIPEKKMIPADERASKKMLREKLKQIFLNVYNLTSSLPKGSRQYIYSAMDRYLKTRLFNAEEFTDELSAVMNQDQIARLIHEIKVVLGQNPALEQDINSLAKNEEEVLNESYQEAVQLELVFPQEEETESVPEGTPEQLSEAQLSQPQGEGKAEVPKPKSRKAKPKIGKGETRTIKGKIIDAAKNNPYEPKKDEVKATRDRFEEDLAKARSNFERMIEETEQPVNPEIFLEKTKELKSKDEIKKLEEFMKGYDLTMDDLVMLVQNPSEDEELDRITDPDVKKRYMDSEESKKGVSWEDAYGKSASLQIVDPDNKTDEDQFDEQRSLINDSDEYASPNLSDDNKILESPNVIEILGKMRQTQASFKILRDQIINLIKSIRVDQAHNERASQVIKEWIESGKNPEKFFSGSLKILKPAYELKGEMGITKAREMGLLTDPFVEAMFRKFFYKKYSIDTAINGEKQATGRFTLRAIKFMESDKPLIKNIEAAMQSLNVSESVMDSRKEAINYKMKDLKSIIELAKDELNSSLAENKQEREAASKYRREIDHLTKLYEDLSKDDLNNDYVDGLVKESSRRNHFSATKYTKYSNYDPQGKNKIYSDPKFKSLHWMTQILIKTSGFLNGETAIELQKKVLQEHSKSLIDKPAFEKIKEASRSKTYQAVSAGDAAMNLSSVLDQLIQGKVFEYYKNQGLKDEDARVKAETALNYLAFAMQEVSVFNTFGKGRYTLSYIGKGGVHVSPEEAQAFAKYYPEIYEFFTGRSLSDGVKMFIQGERPREAYWSIIPSEFKDLLVWCHEMINYVVDSAQPNGVFGSADITRKKLEGYAPRTADFFVKSEGKGKVSASYAQADKIPTREYRTEEEYRFNADNQNSLEAPLNVSMRTYVYNNLAKSAKLELLKTIGEFKNPELPLVNMVTYIQDIEELIKDGKLTIPTGKDPGSIQVWLEKNGYTQQHSYTGLAERHVGGGFKAPWVHSSVVAVMEKIDRSPSVASTGFWKWFTGASDVAKRIILFFPAQYSWDTFRLLAVEKHVPASFKLKAFMGFLMSPALTVGVGGTVGSAVGLASAGLVGGAIGSLAGAFLGIPIGLALAMGNKGYTKYLQSKLNGSLKPWEAYKDFDPLIMSKMFEYNVQMFNYETAVRSVYDRFDEKKKQLIPAMMTNAQKLQWFISSKFGFEDYAYSVQIPQIIYRIYEAIYKRYREEGIDSEEAFKLAAIYLNRAGGALSSFTMSADAKAKQRCVLFAVDYTVANISTKFVGASLGAKEVFLDALVDVGIINEKQAEKFRAKSGKASGNDILEPYLLNDLNKDERRAFAKKAFYMVLQGAFISVLLKSLIQGAFWFAGDDEKEEDLLKYLLNEPGKQAHLRLPWPGRDGRPVYALLPGFNEITELQQMTGFATTDKFFPDFDVFSKNLSEWITGKLNYGINVGAGLITSMQGEEKLGFQEAFVQSAVGPFIPKFVDPFRKGPYQPEIGKVSFAGLALQSAGLNAYQGKGGDLNYYRNERLIQAAKKEEQRIARELAKANTVDDVKRVRGASPEQIRNEIIKRENKPLYQVMMKKGQIKKAILGGLND